MVDMSGHLMEYSLDSMLSQGSGSVGYRGNCGCSLLSFLHCLGCSTVALVPQRKI